MILALDTASEKNSLALIEDCVVLFESSWETKANQAEKLYTQLSEAKERRGLDFSRLAGICVITGPGSFSAVRIGVTTANIIASQLEIPLYPLDLKTLAEVESESFGHSIAAFLATKPKGAKIADAIYDRAPNITKPKHAIYF